MLRGGGSARDIRRTASGRNERDPARSVFLEGAVGAAAAEQRRETTGNGFFSSSSSSSSSFALVKE